MTQQRDEAQRDWQWHNLGQLLVRQVDGASLAAFRVCFGLVVCYYAIKILWPIDGTTYVRSLFTGTDIHFKYPGFAWVRVWPEPWMTVLVEILAVSALMLAVGLFYRLAAVTLFLTWTYYFLAEATVYNNHYYLMVLLSFLLIFMPANRRFALDRLRLHADNRYIPFWPVFLLRFQLFVLYFYGGIAKFNSDWLAGLVVLPQAKQVFSILGEPDYLSVTGISLFIAWSGLFYDLLIGFLLIFRRTRVMAFAMTLFFHVNNHLFFNIGIFPMMALAVTLIFFEPDWPVRAWHWLRHPRIGRADWKWFWWGGLAIPLFGFCLGWKDRISGWSNNGIGTPNRWLKVFMPVWISIQLLVPLRHNLIGGDAEWTEEGHPFAWRMMLRTKDVARLFFVVEDQQLITAGSNGEPAIDWNLWPEEYVRSVYVPVDTRQFRWDARQGFFPICEPVLGHRLFFIPQTVNGQLESPEKTKERIRGHWQSAFSRDPLIYETIPLGDAIATMREELESNPPWVDMSADPARTTELLDEISRILADRLDPASFENEHRYKTVSDLLAELVELNRACALAPALKRLAPFSILGSPFTGRSCYVVEDSRIAETSKVVQQLVGGKSPFMVWLDITRLQPRGWRELPEWCIALDGGKLNMLWNYHSRLNHVQVRRFAQTPYQLRRCASHVAGRWKEVTGRDAKVYVSVQIKFNYIHTGPLIDPQVDLSKASYTLMKHNDWIRPRPVGN